MCSFDEFTFLLKNKRKEFLHLDTSLQVSAGSLRAPAAAVSAAAVPAALLLPPGGASVGGVLPTQHVPLQQRLPAEHCVAAQQLPIQRVVTATAARPWESRRPLVSRAAQRCQATHRKQLHQRALHETLDVAQ